MPLQNFCDLPYGFNDHDYLGVWWAFLAIIIFTARQQKPAISELPVKILTSSADSATPIS